MRRRLGEPVGKWMGQVTGPPPASVGNAKIA